MSIEHTGAGVVWHVGRPDGTFVPTEGEFAGLRMKLIGTGTPMRNPNIAVVHHNPPVLQYFDPGHAKPTPPDPESARAALHLMQAQEKPVVKMPVREIQTEKFTKNTPTEANPFADLQTIEIDEDELVQAETDEGSQEFETIELDEGTTVLDMLLARELRDFGMTAEEFNSVGLSKKQFWKVYEQVIGRVTNKPSSAQAVTTILSKANANAADYSRVIQAIKRAQEPT